MVWRSPTLKKRVLRARLVLRDKASGVGVLNPKARVVLAGYADPDLATIERFSPVLTKTALHFILQIHSSSHVHGVENGWSPCLCTGDVSTAFLQGEPSRPQRLFMVGPQDLLTKASGRFGAPMYEVTGN
eukprot:4862609-Amphidinium_carterae.2